MKHSSLKCCLVPILLSTVLASFCGWLAFKIWFAGDTQSHVEAKLESYPGVSAEVDYHTAKLKGLVDSPAERESAVAAVEGITNDWGIRATGGEIQVRPQLSKVDKGGDGKLSIEGWVNHADEKTALTQLVANEYGQAFDKVNNQGVRVLDYVIPTGAAAITAATAGAAVEGTPIAWLKSVWAALPQQPKVAAAPKVKVPEVKMPSLKMPELTVTEKAKKIFLTGKVSAEATKMGIINWVEKLRPDASVDGTGIEVYKDIATLALPDPESAMSEPSAENEPLLAGVWSGIQTRPSLSFETASASASGGASLKGLVPSEEEWTADLRALTAGASIRLIPTPVVQPTGEDPTAASLGALITAVSPLKEGAVYYTAENGLTVKGYVTEEQDKTIRNISLDALPSTKVTYALTPVGQPNMPQVTKAAEAVLPGGTSVTGSLADGVLKLTGVIPDEEARIIITAAAKKAAPDAKIEDSMTVLPGIRFPSPQLIGDFAGQFAAAPGKRSFFLTDKSLEVQGEVTEDLLSQWKTVMDKMAAKGFATVAKWEVFPSFFHFPSRKVGGTLGADAIAKLKQVLLDNQVFFDTASSKLKRAERPKLEAIATAVKELGSSVQFVVGGHADMRGKAAANQRLSERRVKSVMSALESLGLNMKDFEATSFGASQAEGDDRAALARCRRVEVLLK
jgi:outer membrane protein OmpA-like peptidoglycan-associated protein